jgi:hypothetical protein
MAKECLFMPLKYKILYRKNKHSIAKDVIFVMTP